MILAGQCAMLGPSMPVEVEGGSWGTVQFRVRGDIRQWWTDREWITRQK